MKIYKNICYKMLTEAIEFVKTRHQYKIDIGSDTDMIVQIVEA